MPFFDREKHEKLCRRKAEDPHIRKLMIDLDNGPEVSSQRTQFMKGLTQFADKHNVEIELVYYPPYHSKFNAIELSRVIFTTIRFLTVYRNLHRNELAYRFCCGTRT